MQTLWRGYALSPAPLTGTVPHEAGLSRLDTSKARAQLGRCSGLRLGEALEWIVDGHRRYVDGADARALTLE